MKRKKAEEAFPFTFRPCHLAVFSNCIILGFPAAAGMQKGARSFCMVLFVRCDAPRGVFGLSTKRRVTHVSLVEGLKTHAI